MPATIESVLLIADGGSAQVSTSGGNVKRSYLVTVQEDNADPMEVVTATHPELPNYRDPDTINTAALVSSRAATRAKGARTGQLAKNCWRFDIEWNTPQSISGGGGGGSTDGSDGIQVTIDSSEQTVETQRARDTAQTKIVNSFGDLYPDPQPIVLYDTAIEISYEADSIDNAAWDAAIGKINNGAVTLHLPQGSYADDLGNTQTIYYDRTFAKHTLLMKAAQRSVQISKVTPSKLRWVNRVVLIWREDTWDSTLPDKGYRWLEDDDDPASTPDPPWQDHPEYMDGNGKKLAEGQPIATVGPFQMFVEGDLGTPLGTI